MEITVPHPSTVHTTTTQATATTATTTTVLPQRPTVHVCMDDPEWLDQVINYRHEGPENHTDFF